MLNVYSASSSLIIVYNACHAVWTNISLSPARTLSESKFRVITANTLGVQTFRTFLVATCNLLKTAVIIFLEFLRHVLIRVNNVDQDHTAQIKVV